MRTLALLPLSPEAFAPFGSVIDPDVPCERFAINEGRTQRHHAIAEIDCGEGDGRTGLSIFRAEPVESGFTLHGLERHPLGSQSFINTSGNAFAIVVAPPGDLDEAQICGFLASANQSISYHRGTWHHYLLALGSRSDFVVVDRIGPGHNCDEQTLATPLRLELPA